MSVASKLVGVLWLCAISSGCGSAPPPKARDASADQELQKQLERRATLRADLEAAPADLRKRCEIRAGDCRLEVNDGRDKILRQHPSAECRSASDSDAEFSCVAEKLNAKGESHLTSAYYKLENWCTQKLVVCTSEIAAEEHGNAQKALAQSRAEQVESSRKGFGARAEVSFAEERVAYLRAMLPPQADGACNQSDALEKCRSASQELDAKFRAELDLAEGAYDANRATQAYEAARGAEAACFTPEFECLKKRLDAFGGSAETRKYMEQTLKSLERRQRLVEEKGSEQAKGCLNAGLSQYQSRIVDDYQRFSHEPVLFFQAQLHRDFRALYDTQASCLQARARGSMARN